MIRIGGNVIVDSLVQAETVKPAVGDVWSILTSLLRESAVAGVVIGLLGILAAWLIGPPGARRRLDSGLRRPFATGPSSFTPSWRS